MGATEQRLEELMSVVLALVSFDYRKKATVSDANDVFDGLAYGLNMLGEELAASTVSKTYVDDVIESLRDPLVVVDASGEIQTVNNATLYLTDWERYDLLRRPVTLLLPNVPLSELLESADGEQLLRTKSGSDVSVSITTSKMSVQADGTQHYTCLMRDLTQVKRAEAERWRMREALQRQTILVEELSTPLIPLTRDLVVMPIVGTLDQARMTHVMETLLEGIVARKSKTAILDITGVKSFDTAAVHELLRCVGAVRLVGAEVMLTGIGPEAATALAHLDVELDKVETFASLAHAVAHALAL